MKRNQNEILLDGSYSVTIRKVSMDVLGTRAFEVALKGNLLALGIQNAKEASEALSSAQGYPQRDHALPLDPDQLLLESFQSLTFLKQQAVRFGVVEFEKVLEDYGGSVELPDFGLGSDFDVISSAVIQFSGGGDSLGVEEAKRFLESVWNAVGRNGGTVQQTPQ